MAFPYSHILSIHEEQGEKGQLFLSSVGMLAKPEIMQALRVGAVLTVMDPWAYSHYKVREKVEHLNLVHKWVQIQDDEESPLLPHLPLTSQFITEQLTKHNVLVHCQAGVSRSPAVIIAFLMQTQHLSYPQAKAAVKKKRPCIQPNKGFENQLINWVPHNPNQI